MSLVNISSFYIASNRLDHDLNGDALIPSSLQSWYDAITSKAIEKQSNPPSRFSELIGNYGIKSDVCLDPDLTVSYVECSALADLFVQTE